MSRELTAEGCYAALEPHTSEISGLRSVTYYRFGIRLEDMDTEHLRQDVARAREIGFNVMWLVVPWRSLSPVALPEPQLSTSAWKKPDAMVDRPVREGARVGDEHLDVAGF